MYRLKWSNKALKNLKSIPRKQAELIFSWTVKHLDGCDNPRAIDGGKQLAGTKDGWRYRVGSYRILCQLLDEELVVKVVRAGHRQGVYNNLPKL